MSRNSGHFLIGFIKTRKKSAYLSALFICSILSSCKGVESIKDIKAGSNY